MNALPARVPAARLRYPRQEISGSARKEEGVQEDAVSALVNLGYSVKSAKEAVDRAMAGAKDITLESLIKKALRVLA